MASAADDGTLALCDLSRVAAGAAETNAATTTSGDASGSGLEEELHTIVASDYGKPLTCVAFGSQGRLACGGFDCWAHVYAYPAGEARASGGNAGMYFRIPGVDS